MLTNTRQRLKRAALALLKGDFAPKAVTRQVPAITPEEVADAKKFFPLDKYFIYGHARSGTTLLARLIRLHPNVHCNYQAHFFTRAPLLESLVSSPEVGDWLSRRSNRWNQGRDLSPLVLRVTADFILEREARALGKRVVGDKSPNSLLDGEAVELMTKVYPDARLIFIVRDGRDTTISHRFQAFIDTPQSLSREDLQIREDFSRDSAPFFTGQRSLFSENQIRRAAESWVHNVRETDRMAQKLLGEQYCRLRYEDLLENPLAQMRKLWGFLGVDVNAPGLAESLAAEMQQNPDADWQQKKAGEIVAPLQKGKTGSWRELFTARDKDIFKEVAGQTLIDWQYERGLDW